MVGLVAGGPSGRVRDFFVVGDVAGFAGLDHLALDAAEMAQAGIGFFAHIHDHRDAHDMPDPFGRGQRFARTADPFHQTVHVQIEHADTMCHADSHADFIACQQQFDGRTADSRSFASLRDI